jgi:hypothetical protein
MCQKVFNKLLRYNTSVMNMLKKSSLVLEGCYNRLVKLIIKLSRLVFFIRQNLVRIRNLPY